jgi:hypothetical protein
MPKKNRKSRGFILLTHTLMMAITIGFVGLAVDAGTMYVIKGRLSSAVDAAALAAGRSLNLANTLSAAQTAATATANQFFTANFPSGFLGAGTPTVSIPPFVDETDANGNPTGILDIAVTASVPAPTYFIRILNVVPFMSAPNSVVVSATGTATRRGTVMMLVLDTSISMITPPDANGLTSCQEMANAASQFITDFSPYDTIGVITFNATATLMYAPAKTFGSDGLGANLAALGTTCGSSTNTTAALHLAYQEIKSVGLPLAYNSIVLFTDGSPNGANASFPIRTTADTRYGEDSKGTTGICPSYSTTCAMPVLCTSTTPITGVITQGNAQNVIGATSGVSQSISTDPSPVYPAGCSSATLNGAMRQMVDYIPDTDSWGNSTHGVVATGAGPTVAAVNGVNMVTRDFWIFQENNLCGGSLKAVACANTANGTNPNFVNGGALWSGFGGVGSGSNFFTAAAGNAALVGHFRPDQPNTIVAVSMNTAMAEAYNIRADASGCGTNGSICPTLFHPVINTIYLTGNSTDSVDREFLQVMANVQTITALPYDTGFVQYTNPAFQTNQEQGLYQVTADSTQLNNLFAKLASEVLRLSH